MLLNWLPPAGPLAWPVAIAIAWVVGELGHRLTSLPRISLYGLVGFGLGNTSLGLLPPASADGVMLMAMKGEPFATSSPDPAQKSTRRPTAVCTGHGQSTTCHPPTGAEMELPDSQRRQSAMTSKPVVVLILGLALSVGLAIGAFSVRPQLTKVEPAIRAPTPFVAAKTGAKSDPRWASLSDSQRATLRPLMAFWPSLVASDRQSWLSVAARLRGLSGQAKARVDARMVAWAKLTPEKRTQARLRYVYARQVPAAERQLRWRTYQAMTKGSLLTESDNGRLALVAPAMVQVRPGATTVFLTELPGTFARSSDLVPRSTEPR